MRQLGAPGVVPVVVASTTVNVSCRQASDGQRKLPSTVNRAVWLAGTSIPSTKLMLLLPRQGSSACCCILTRRASEGSASEPALRVGRYVRFESPLHAGLQVAGDREPKEIREQFKAWCTRRLKALQQERLRPLSAQDCSAAAIRQKWWAERGSALYVNDEEGLEAVIHYVREAQDYADQPQPDERERSQS